MKRFTPKDLPLLRSMRETWGRLLEAAEAVEQEEPTTDAGILIARITVKQQIRDAFDHFGRELSRLERVPC